MLHYLILIKQIEQKSIFWKHAHRVFHLLAVVPDWIVPRSSVQQVIVYYLKGHPVRHSEVTDDSRVPWQWLSQYRGTPAA